MTLNTVKKISVFFTFLFCLNNSTNAALITTNFSELVGNQGTVDINLSLADGELMNGLSVYFAEDLFADLAIVTSPAEWDSLVFQPDPLLGAGLFDSYSIDGLTSGAARISFTYLSSLPFQASLQSLAYDIYDTDFELVSSGVSTAASVSVPESSPMILMMIGLIALGLRRRVRTTSSMTYSFAH
ncbi:PEP-CTERM sorting domain-containing protein [Cellvibrio sp. NN19]|uniref:PEP-CTERM sorting domain-containing protein n=1 Tax=Cellvibrio chitinivorans TaxID=3102792 RepID=UPI002B400C3E|nr:PEP-CTERM sorting domain-containing protein [Cellvibrio sp. NN19]